MKPKNDPKNPNANNGIACTCCMKDGVLDRSSCHASHHTEREERFEEFVDKNGVQIQDGDKLIYVNPHFPDRKQPIHEAIWSEVEKRMYFKVEGKSRRARQKSRWTSERFEILPASA